MIWTCANPIFIIFLMDIDKSCFFLNLFFGVSNDFFQEVKLQLTPCYQE